MLSASDPVEPNISEQERQQPDRPARSGRAVALWLACLAFLVLLGPIYLTSTYAKGETASLQASLESAEATLTAAFEPDPTSQALRQALEETAGQVQETDLLSEQLQNADVDWSHIMSALSQYDPQALVLTTVSQDGARLALEGLAADEDVVVRYVRSLEDSRLFSHVTLQSMKSTERTDVPFPSHSLAPSTPSAPTPYSPPSATPKPTLSNAAGDKYEPDEGQAPMLLPGQPQQHSFDPENDTDRVRFLAKQGRSYRVYTSELAQGVDTSLVVRLDGWAYANDDEQPGMLTSSVLIHAPADRDAEALLEISNRGVYGPAQTYTVNVEEVLTTPTPSPAPTLSPTPQPTPTFDLRDGHEPDDQSPTIIEPGESQTHSFYPDGDVDRLSFLAQGHKAYRVYTEGLAPDVDTFLYVRVGADSYVHDNVGENDPRSEVCIEIGDTENVTVIIEVSNRGRYGPAQWYRIAVEEIDPVPTCTPTPTMTPVPGDAVASSPTLTMPTGTPVAILQQEPTRLMVAAKDSVYTAHRRGLCAPFDTQQNSVNGRAALLQGESGITLQYAAFDDANESAEGTSVVEFAILLEMEIAP